MPMSFCIAAIVLPWVLACAGPGRRPLPEPFDALARRECRDPSCGGPDRKLTLWVDGSGRATLLGVMGDYERCSHVNPVLYDRAGTDVWVGLDQSTTEEAEAASSLAFDHATAGLTLSRELRCAILEPEP